MRLCNRCDFRPVTQTIRLDGCVRDWTGDWTGKKCKSLGFTEDWTAGRVKPPEGIPVPPSQFVRTLCPPLCQCPVPATPALLDVTMLRCYDPCYFVTSPNSTKPRKNGSCYDVTTLRPFFRPGREN